MQDATFDLRNRLTVPALLLAGVVWSYWTTLAALASKWSADPQYSHGFLVPVIAAWICWSRYRAEDCESWSPSWWGLPVLLCGLGIRLFGTYFYFEWLDGASLLPTVAGLCLVVGGWTALKVCWPGVVFLGFMLPLPYTLEIALAGPLQSLATSASTYALQTLGCTAVAEGNVILLENIRIGVAEACSGLRMLVVFFAICTGVAMMLRRSVWERITIVVSAVPIALACNCIRIVITGLMHLAFGQELADRVFHDVSGWLMMPMALGFVWLELQVLSRLLIDVPPREVIPVLPTRGQALMYDSAKLCSPNGAK